MIRKYIYILLENEKFWSFILVPIKYSFIFWLLIIAIISYQFFQSYKKIQITKHKTLRQLLNEEKKLKRKKLELEDIKTSYETIIKYVSIDKINLIKTKLDQSLLSLQDLNKSFEKRYENFPVIITSFNLKDSFLQSLKPENYSLEDIKFDSDSYKYFLQYLATMEKDNLKLIKIKGNVKISLYKKLLILTFIPDEKGFLEAENIYIKGFVSNILSNPYFTSTTILKSKEDNWYSNFVFGWNIKFKKEGK